MFADLINNNSDSGKFIFKALFLGSENLYDWQRERIRRAFPNSKQFSWYGHAEKTVLAMECEESSSYHNWPFYGMTEILDENHTEVKVGESGEIIGTSFWNYATPFIRYRTMDRPAKVRADVSIAAGSFNLIDSIEGRLQEFIVTSKGVIFP